LQAIATFAAAPLVPAPLPRLKQDPLNNQVYSDPGVPGTPPALKNAGGAMLGCKPVMKHLQRGA
jgi:hypothetical protein